MDGTKFQVAINSLLECCICLQVYEDPRNLPCGHTFCLKCIQDNTSRLCPLCKAVWPIPAIGFHDLPKNFIAKSLIESLPSMSNCVGPLEKSSSRHGPVLFFCVDCWDPLCKECAREHTLLDKPTKHHEVKRMVDIDQSDIKKYNEQKNLACSEHKDETIKFFCINCDKFICHTCYLSSHNAHTYVSQKERDTDQTNKINDSVSSINKHMEKYEALNRQRLMKIKALENHHETVIQGINIMISDVKRKLKNVYEELIHEVDECLTNALQLITERVSTEKRKLNKVIADTKAKLCYMEESVSLLKRHLPPLSSAVKREKLLEGNSFTQLEEKTEDDARVISNFRLSCIFKWKSEINTWFQLLMQAMSSASNIPLLKDEETGIAGNRFYSAYYTFIAH